MKYKNRLFELRGSESQASFASKLGMTQQNYANYENGKQGLKSDLIEKICTKFGCSAEWLLCLDGENRVARTQDGGRFIDVPLFGSIAAGTPIEMIAVEDTFPVPVRVHEKHPDAFLLKVVGESMNKILPNGSYALVDPCNDVEVNGQPYAVCVNGFDATVKRVDKLANGFRLKPDSNDPTYAEKTYNYNEPDTEQITIIGKVVYYVLPYDWRF